MIFRTLYSRLALTLFILLCLVGIQNSHESLKGDSKAPAEGRRVLELEDARKARDRRLWFLSELIVALVHGHESPAGVDLRKHFVLEGATAENEEPSVADAHHGVAHPRSRPTSAATSVAAVTRLAGASAVGEAASGSCPELLQALSIATQATTRTCLAPGVIRTGGL